MVCPSHKGRLVCSTLHLELNTPAQGSPPPKKKYTDCTSSSYSVSYYTGIRLVQLVQSGLLWLQSPVKVKFSTPVCAVSVLLSPFGLGLYYKWPASTLGAKGSCGLSLAKIRRREREVCGCSACRHVHFN